MRSRFCSKRINSSTFPMTPHLREPRKVPRETRGQAAFSALWDRSAQCAGGERYPPIFFPATRFTAVFPPMEASTWASTVVGICTNSIPRMSSEASSPPTSPTIPPPSATITALRSAPASPTCRPEPPPSPTAWWALRRAWKYLRCEPGGLNELTSFAPQRVRTGGTVTTKMRLACGSNSLRTDPARASRPFSIMA